MTVNACVLLADGFEEIEAVTVIDVLRRAGVAVTTVGVKSDWVKGAHGITIQSDVPLKEAAPMPWHVVVLPGGGPGAKTLRDDQRTQQFLKIQYKLGKKIAAICAAPIALAEAGLLQGKKATCYPGFEDELGGANFVSQNVVTDGQITTSRGPGTALPFAFNLVEQLVGKSKAEELCKATLFSDA